MPAHESDQNPASEPEQRATVLESALVVSVFDAWRRMITSLAAGGRVVSGWTAALARSWIHQWSAVAAYHRNPGAAWADESGADARRTAAALGARAFIFGLVVAVVLATSNNAAWGPTVAAAIAELLWAAGRFVIIAWLLPRGTINRERLTIVFLAALTPYAIGVTSGLRVLAFAGSAYLTYRGLTGAGAAERDARLATGWAFGGQVGALLGSWLVRAAVAYIAGA